MNQPMRTTAFLLALSCGLLGARGGQAQTPMGDMHQQHHPAAQTPDHFEHAFNAEEWAKSGEDPARDAWQMPDRVIDALGLKAGQAVADIGAGTGYFSARLAKSSARPTVYASDLEPTMVEWLKKRAASEHLPNLTAVKAAADSPNLPAPVDVVLIVDTYHHIGGRVAYFTKLRQSMKPGARLAIIDFRKDSPDGPPVEFRMQPEQITAELVQAGFALKVSHTFLPRQLFLVYEVAAR